MNTHNLVCDFGRHAGELYTRIPISYLRWMVNNGHSKASIAQAELDRRGTTVPTLEISGHAIDRASQKLLTVWQESREGDEGLHSWLHRNAEIALSAGDYDGDNRIYGKIKWCFSFGESWPTLVTVMSA